jgi:hypothetical protein
MSIIASRLRRVLRSDRSLSSQVFGSRRRSLVIKAVRALGYELIRTSLGRDGSNFSEAQLIADFVAALRPKPLAVDIGAYDGYSMSNSLSLFMKGWSGLAIECAPHMFAKLSVRYSAFPSVSLARLKVTPDNIVPLLRAYSVPSDFGFLNLDIDSFDYFVLDRLLEAYRPALICAEINEKIPPPIRFTVAFSENFSYERGDFYGMSISMLDSAAKRHRYVIVALEYNNAFLIPREIVPVAPLTAEEAYNRGYKARPDRLLKLPWNSSMEPVQTLPLPEAVKFIRERFHRYEGLYCLEA